MLLFQGIKKTERRTLGRYVRDPELVDAELASRMEDKAGIRALRDTEGQKEWRRVTGRL